MPPVIDKETCIKCGTCDSVCPLDVIHMEEPGPEIRYPDECWHCGACRQDCPVEAISIEFTPSMLCI